VRGIGEVVDATTAFIGAAVAGVTLFLPIAVGTQTGSASYQLAGLLNSEPRGAALGAIVAVMVAVLITTTSRPLIGWATATAGSMAQLINHLAAPEVPSADLLTTQNYLDSVCGAVVLGALGAAVLLRPLPAAAFALGGVCFFAFGDLTELVDVDTDRYAVLETPPRWLIWVTVALLITSTVRNWSRTQEPQTPVIATELPVAPILAAVVLAVVVLAGTEWLGRQFSKMPDEGHAVEIGIVVAATIVSATAAAMLLPGRDGTGVYLAVSLSAAADAVGYATRPDWVGGVLIMLAALGVVAGVRAGSTAVAIVLVGGISIFAMVTSTSAGAVRFAAISVLIAMTAGYCCGVARPREVSSGVLAIAALYLPTVVSVMPYKVRSWHGAVPTHDATPGTAALAVTIGSAVGLIALRKLRPPGKPHSNGQPESERLADT
jgi:hypothetical protein